MGEDVKYAVAHEKQEEDELLSFTAVNQAVEEKRKEKITKKRAKKAVKVLTSFKKSKASFQRLSGLAPKKSVCSKLSLSSLRSHTSSGSGRSLLSGLSGSLRGRQRLSPGPVFPSITVVCDSESHLPLKADSLLIGDNSDRNILSPDWSAGSASGTYPGRVPIERPAEASLWSADLERSRVTGIARVSQARAGSTTSQGLVRPRESSQRHSPQEAGRSSEVPQPTERLSPSLPVPGVAAGGAKSAWSRLAAAASTPLPGNPFGEHRAWRHSRSSRIHTSSGGNEGDVESQSDTDTTGMLEDALKGILTWVEPRHRRKMYARNLQESIVACLQAADLIQQVEAADERGQQVQAQWCRCLQVVHMFSCGLLWLAASAILVGFLTSRPDPATVLPPGHPIRHCL